MEVVGSFESAVGWSSTPMPGQDFVSPADDGVDDVVELGEFTGGVGISEATQCGECAVVVFGEVEAVEFLEGVRRLSGDGDDRLHRREPSGVRGRADLH